MRTTKKRLTTIWMGCAGIVVLWGGSTLAQQTGNPLHDAATGALSAATITVSNGSTVVTRKAPFFSGGLITAGQEALGLNAAAAEAKAELAPAFDAAFPDLGMTKGTLGCSERDEGGFNNVRVNQDCTYRRQAEEKIVFNPTKPENLVAGMNDSRVGYNQCGIAWSTDNGQHWGDMLPPFRQRINNPAGMLPTASNPNRNTILGGPGTNHTYDFASDPGPAFDSAGRAFFSCVALDVNFNASMLFVTQSPLGAKGSFFFNLETAPGNRSFVPVEDNNPNVLHDKPFTVADTFSQSPNRDNVYVTWTVFFMGCGAPGAYCSSPIYGSMSTDHGVTWSTPEEISGNSTSLCFFGNFFDPTRKASDCDFDQGSDPQVLPNGNLVVVFNNGNTAATNPNAQQLAVHCKPSGSSPAGTARLNCGAPNKVGDDVVVNEPLCNFGRGPEECVPGPFIRTNDFPRLAVNRLNGHLYAVWQDYRNGEFDIQIAQSTDEGAKWSASTTVNPDSRLDHYFAAVDVAQIPGPDRVGVSYFRSQRVPNENTTPAAGFAPGQPGVQQANSDYVLAGGTGLAGPYNFLNLSPVFAPPDGVQAGFNGDYSGLTINQGEEAHPIWSDTRNRDPFAPADGVIHDEDVFTTAVELPNGVAKPHIGQLGQE